MTSSRARTKRAGKDFDNLEHKAAGSSGRGSERRRHSSSGWFINAVTLEHGKVVIAWQRLAEVAVLKEVAWYSAGDPIAPIAARAQRKGSLYRELMAPHDPQLIDPIGTSISTS